MSRTERKLKIAMLKPKEGTYWCRRCGVEGKGFAKYSETTYGYVNIHSIMGDNDVEYGDEWETTDTDDHNTYAYECDPCGLKSENSLDVFTTIMSAPLIARIAMLRLVEKVDMDWSERREYWKNLKPVTPEQEKGREIEYDEPKT